MLDYCNCPHHERYHYAVKATVFCNVDGCDCAFIDNYLMSVLHDDDSPLAVIENEETGGIAAAPSKEVAPGRFEVTFVATSPGLHTVEWLWPSG